MALSGQHERAFTDREHEPFHTAEVGQAGETLLVNPEEMSDSELVGASQGILENVGETK